MTGWKRAARLAVLVLAPLVTAVGAYYLVVVMRARRSAPELVRAALGETSASLKPGDLSPDQVQALLAVQDPGFFKHRGWDFSGGTMTTITQALVKKLYFDPFRPGLAKIEQSLIARFALDPRVSKEDQLELFINTVYLGTIDGVPVNGLANGAARYFGKELADLEGDEFLALLACFHAPDRMNPRHAAASVRRVGQIKRLLAGECERGGLLGRGETCWTQDP